jgi:hypothetical protein
VRVVYLGGKFVPEDECQVEEGTEGLVLIEPSDLTTQQPDERRQLLSELVAEMRKNPLRPDRPRLTRDQMHERH